jgi:voltage-dependent calcium channel T type alpha-1G
LFVLSSKDGWIEIMYDGIDAVGVDQEPIENYNEWMIFYFISFVLLVGFIVLNMFVGVVVENFHKCWDSQEVDEKTVMAKKKQKLLHEKRKQRIETSHLSNYSRPRQIIFHVCKSKYFELVSASLIGINVIIMAFEYYMMPRIVEQLMEIIHFIFSVIFVLEGLMRIFALGFKNFIKEKWNQIDLFIIVVSFTALIYDKLNGNVEIPINPTLIRVIRVIRITRALKLLKMANGIRSLIDTIIQALPEVGNLSLLFFLLYFIFSSLGVELFGKLDCEIDLENTCDGINRHAHFHNFGMSFLTLFRIATGDNWNGIMRDALGNKNLCIDENGNESTSFCLTHTLTPFYFVFFILMAQFVLINVVVAVLLKRLDDSNKTKGDDARMEYEIDKELEEEALNIQLLKDGIPMENINRKTKQIL